MSNLRKSPKLPTTSPSWISNSTRSVGGGGSKSKDRRLKLQAKNENLNEERKRRAQDEKQSNKTKDLGTVKDTGMIDTDSSIHPSRRSRVAND